MSQLTEKQVETACAVYWGDHWNVFNATKASIRETMAKALSAALAVEARADPITPHIFAQEYEFRSDGGDYTPTDGERAMIEDAIYGYLGVVEADNNIRSALTPASSAVEEEDIQSYFERQIVCSRETFGPALRTGGVIDHIRKELREIEGDPHDLSEWIDVVILAMDGFWRHGGKAADLLPSLLAKQKKNMARVWPDWRTMSEDSAIEHDQSGE